MPLIIVKEDITKMNVDAVVNPANPTLLGGGGIDGEIHRAAGKKLLEECRVLGSCATGEAKLTKGYDLPAKYIIHTVGPIWQGGTNGERELLCMCYRNSLAIAAEKRCNTIAVPIISAGAYGYPYEEAVNIAKSEIIRFIDDHDDITVYLVLRERLIPEKNRLYSQIEYFMMQNGISATDDVPSEVFVSSPSKDIIPRAIPNTSVPTFGAVKKTERRKSSATAECDDICRASYSIMEPDLSEYCQKSSSPKNDSLEDMLKKLDKSFSETLLHLIDLSGMKDSECYKRANIDRKLFSKIRSNKDYKPSKSTVLAFAIALQLDLDDTRMLLERAGFALSPSSKFDAIIKFFIINGIYDIFEINDALFAFDQPLLGA